MKSKYYKFLSNRNPKIIDLLLHKILCLESYFSRMSFSRSEFTIVSYLYDDYRNLVHKYNVLLGESGKSARFMLFPFENIDFSLDDE